MSNNKKLSAEEQDELLKTLKTRFEKNRSRHNGLEWAKLQTKLEANPGKLWSLHQMELSGGEPDVVGHDKMTGEYLFYDCSPKHPKNEETFVTTVKPWIPGKNINRQTAPWIWQQLWVLNY
nr:DUF4256 domain-containing protein [Paraflavitalea speifideiaquila]